LEYNGDDQENCGQRDVVGHFEVHRRGLDQIGGHGGLARDHGVGVVSPDNALQLIQLAGHLVRGGIVFGVDHDHLIAALLEHILHAVGHKEIGNSAAQQRVVGDDGGDALEVLDLIFHIVHICGGQIVPQDDKMGGRHVVFAFQLVVGDDGRHGLGQGLIQLVIDAGVGLCPDKGDEQQQKDRYILFAMRNDGVVELFEAGQQRTVAVLFDLLVEDQQHRGQHKDDGHHA